MTLGRSERRARRRWFLFRREIWRSGSSGRSRSRRWLAFLIPPWVWLIRLLDRLSPIKRTKSNLSTVWSQQNFPCGRPTQVDDNSEELLAGSRAVRQVREDRPLISILIPTRDRVDLLSDCLRSLTGTTWENFEVIIADNDSEEAETQAFLASVSHRVVPAPGKFNYSRIINTAARHATGAYLLTLNNDVVVTDPEWLTSLLEYAHGDVGIVGCSLVEPSGESQHVGVAIAPYPQHLRAGVNIPADHPLVTTPRRVSAVTGACTLIARDVWERLGGLNENLPVVLNDIDMCLRAGALGVATVVASDVVLQHAESSTRGSLVPSEDIFTFMATWGICDSFRDPWFPAHWRLVGNRMVWSYDV